MDKGYIKLHRSLLDWEYWDDRNTTRLLIYILLSANWEEKKWMGEVIDKGSFATSYQNISAKTGLSVKQIRVSMDKLERCNEVARKTTNKYQVIRLLKWDKLQIENIEGQAKGRQRAGKGQQLKNTKKLKEIYRSFDHLTLTTEELEKLKDNYTKEQIDTTLDSIENYKGNKKYKSLYLTANNWLKKSYPKGKRESLRPY